MSITIVTLSSQTERHKQVLEKARTQSMPRLQKLESRFAGIPPAVIRFAELVFALYAILTESWEL